MKSSEKREDKDFQYEAYVQEYLDNTYLSQLYEVQKSIFYIRSTTWAFLFALISADLLTISPKLKRE